MPDHHAGDCLRQAEEILGGLIAQAEPSLRPVGDLLAHAIAVLGRMADGLYGLVARLQGEQAARAARSLTDAVAQTRMLAHGSHQETAGLLAQLERDAANISRDLEGLRRIVGDVTALTINGKIQSALVTAAGVDFSVFTSGIGRLGLLATMRIEQVSARLATVGQAVAAALQAEGAFARNEAAELADIRGRLEGNLSLLADRSRRAAQALDAVQGRSRQVSGRVGATIGQLQANDIACQRLDHVRLTLQEMAQGVWPAGAAVLAAPGLRRAACDLLRLQLDQAAADYAREIEAVIDNLRGLSDAAGGLLTEAEQAFGDSQGGLFLTDIERDVARAVSLLEAYAQARRHTATMVEAASQGFLAMAEDLVAIRSIDADMRVMGLNATLKCGRLGEPGRALGVVAQELRACSRQTEDATRAVGALLETALANSRRLMMAGEAGDGVSAEAPHRVMEQSVADLSQVAAAMGDLLGAVRREAPPLAAALADCAGGLAFHRHLRAAIDQASALIDAACPVGAPSGGDGPPPYGEAEYAALRAHFEPRYTMDAERALHAAFDGGPDMAFVSASASGPDPGEPDGGDAGVDDFFF